MPGNKQPLVPGMLVVYILKLRLGINVQVIFTRWNYCTFSTVYNDVHEYFGCLQI